ncbi:hypothetical protein ACEWY4_018245 [Coilia grayii]|uniref:Myb/SANT-like DNA-binding domain-containing protein n=1 Tax=Coilia grayii TaxID=363190 RepID=A0ABD1JLX2_9TELE
MLEDIECREGDPDRLRVSTPDNSEGEWRSGHLMGLDATCQFHFGLRFIVRPADSTRGNMSELDSRQKKQAWEGIATKLAATTGVARTGEEVRKKWQDFSSLAKRKAAAVRRDTTATGGGPTTAAPLTLEEERAVDHAARRTLAPARPAPPQRTSPLPNSPQPTSPQPASTQRASPGPATAETALPQPAPRMCSPTPASATLATLSEQCSCSQDLVQLEREKLEVLKELRDTVKEASARDARFQQELLVVKRAKLELEARRLLLAEQKLARPSLSLPVLWPEPEGEMSDMVNPGVWDILHQWKPSSSLHL